MSGRLFKLIGLAALGGGGVYAYREYNRRHSRDFNVEKAGKAADDGIMHLSGKAQEVEHGVTVRALQAKDNIQQTAASLSDKAISSVDTAADQTEGALAKMKGWISGR